jgi:hypothetical protein
MHHSSEWLSEDFELPARLRGVKGIHAWRVHRAKDTGLIGLKLGPEHGTGIWDAGGKLLHYFERGGDLDFLPVSQDALSLECLFKQSTKGAANPNSLRRLQIGSWKELAAGEVPTPVSHGQYLILDHKGEKGVVTWREQREWGYVAFDVRNLTPLSVALEWKSATLSPPSFSPDDSVIVSCHYHRNRWWVTEDGDWYDPSPGGLHRVSTITVHALASNTVTQHDVFVTVDAGWLPDRPEEVEWQLIWGPEFTSAREFRIWLPDDSERILSLPLPPKIEIGRPLESKRAWPE